TRVHTNSKPFPYTTHFRSRGESQPPVPGTFDLLTQSMDLMQANLSRLRLAAYEPDLLVQLPRNMASVYEFYRARELIELGREQRSEEHTSELQSRSDLVCR